MLKWIGEIELTLCFKMDAEMEVSVVYCLSSKEMDMTTRVQFLNDVIAFRIALISLGKVWIQWFSLQMLIS